MGCSPSRVEQEQDDAVDEQAGALRDAIDATRRRLQGGGKLGTTPATTRSASSGGTPPSPDPEELAAEELPTLGDAPAPS